MTFVNNEAHLMMEQTISSMLRPGMGILAADEGPAVMSARFRDAGINEGPDTAADYREMLFATQDAFGTSVSGVIVEEGTIGRRGRSDKPLTAPFEQAGAVMGIKVDRGLVADPGFPEETLTSGIDDLPDRLEAARKQGAKFAKWRAAFKITDVLPSEANVVYNLSVMAKYAATCQAFGIVPIVEPEILASGAHRIERCADVTEYVLRMLYQQLYEKRVVLEKTILKPNMVTPGTSWSGKADDSEIAEKTIMVFRRAVPAAVPGIAFLSGGQSECEATARLDAICKIGGSPWRLTFSYGRGLQDSARKLWAGNSHNSKIAQAAFARRAGLNRLAALGAWSQAHESSSQH